MYSKQAKAKISNWMKKHNINEIEALPQSNKEMQTLDLSHNNLIDILEEIFDNENIVYMKIDNNKLTSISSKIINFSKLTHLDASNNQLKQLPRELLDLTKLECITIRDNSNVLKQCDIVKALKKKGITVLL